jgi:hypothetical protein
VFAVALGVLVIASISASSSFTGADATAGGVPARARLGVPFDLAYGQSVQVAGSDIEISFLNVTEDSRCPSDVTCVWAGQVSVMFNLTQTSGTDLGIVVLTVGAGSNASSAERQVGEYTLRLVDVKPYPASTTDIPLSDYVATIVLSKGGSVPVSRSLLVMAIGGNDTQSPAIARFISGWSVERETGVAVFVLREGSKLVRVIARFLPFYAECTHGSGMSDCIDGQITRISGNAGVMEGNFIHLEVDSSNSTLYVSFKSPMAGNATGVGTGAATEYTLQVRKFKELVRPFVPPDGTGTIVTLREGQREGPLLVQRIFPDRVEGLNFPEYPVAMDQGLPITLRVGEMASNGCTVMLTLLRIDDGSATFLKKVDENRPCPICWYQLELISGLP